MEPGTKGRALCSVVLRCHHLGLGFQIALKNVLFITSALVYVIKWRFRRSYGSTPVNTSGQLRQVKLDFWIGKVKRETPYGIRMVWTLSVGFSCHNGDLIRRSPPIMELKYRNCGRNFQECQYGVVRASIRASELTLVMTD